MTHATNKWDSAFLFYAPKIIAIAIFFLLDFTPESWNTWLLIVGFVALAIEVVLDIVRFRHWWHKQTNTEEEEESEDEICYQKEQDNTVQPNTTDIPTPKSADEKWEKIEKWGDVVDKFDDYSMLAWIIGGVIFIFCVKFVLPWFK